MTITALPHVHATDTEEATGPDHTGTLVVVEVCSCGLALRTYTDSVL